MPSTDPSSDAPALSPLQRMIQEDESRALAFLMQTELPYAFDPIPGTTSITATQHLRRQMYHNDDDQYPFPIGTPAETVFMRNPMSNKDYWSNRHEIHQQVNKESDDDEEEDAMAWDYGDYGDYGYKMAEDKGNEGSEEDTSVEDEDEEGEVQEVEQDDEVEVVEVEDTEMLEEEVDGSKANKTRCCVEFTEKMTINSPIRALINRNVYAITVAKETEQLVLGLDERYKKLEQWMDEGEEQLRNELEDTKGKLRKAQERIKELELLLQ